MFGVNIVCFLGQNSRYKQPRTMLQIAGSLTFSQVSFWLETLLKISPFIFTRMSSCNVFSVEKVLLHYLRWEKRPEFYAI